MFKDDRVEISIEDFREHYCSICYWRDEKKCDIAKVKLIKFCTHAQVKAWEIKLKEE